MSELSHQGAHRLIHQDHLTSAEQQALRAHLRQCADCRQRTAVAAMLARHLSLRPVRHTASSAWTADYLRSAARRYRRSQIMKPVVAVGGLAAMLLLMLAGWFIVRSNLLTIGLLEPPQLPAISLSEAQESDTVETIFAAVEAGDTDAVARLLAQGADVNGTLNSAGEGKTPLMAAAAHNRLELIQPLVTAGAVVDQQEKPGGNTALFYAAQLDNTDIVQMLLEEGADPDLQDENGWSPLHVAAQYGYLSTTRALLNGAADVNLPDNKGMTPLMLTLARGDERTYTILLANGADPNYQDNDGNTALHHAVQANLVDAIPLLLKAGASLTVANNQGQTPLDVAEYDSTAELLREAGATTGTQEESEPRPTIDLLALAGAEMTPLDQSFRDAVKASDAAAVAGLLEQGANPLLVLPSGYPILKTAVMEAVDSGDNEIVQLLLASGADVNQLDGSGNAMLPLAIGAAKLELAQLLLDAGADPNGPMSFNVEDIGFLKLAPAIIHAVSSNSSDIVTLLLERGADVNRTEADGYRTALHVAAGLDRPAIIETLLTNGADPDPPGPQTPLQQAAEFQKVRSVQALLAGGADPNAQPGTQGKTALMYAVTWGRAQGSP